MENLFNFHQEILALLSASLSSHTIKRGTLKNSWISNSQFKDRFKKNQDGYVRMLIAY